MVHEYMGLAGSLAQQVWRTAPHALELDELRGIAYLGLVAAAARWKSFCAENNHNPNAMEFFRPFVVRRVYGSLIDAIRASDWASRNMRTRAKALREAGQDKGLSHEELAARTGMSVKEVRVTIRDMAQRPVSMEAEELDPDSRIDVESTVLTRTLLAATVSVIQSLPPEEQAVIALHYYRGLQLQQVARTLGITESRASQLHAQAVLAIHAAQYTTAQQKD